MEDGMKTWHVLTTVAFALVAALAFAQGPVVDSRPENKAANRAKKEQTANLAAIKIDLDQVEAALDQINVSASSSYATNIAACTGAAKTALQDTRNVLVDVKIALKNLRQACEKIRREVR
jgi:hypothetical protein